MSDSFGIDGRLTVPIGPDMRPAPAAVVIRGTELTPLQASVLRELVRDACATSGVYHDKLSEEFDHVCRQLYQLIKTVP